MEATSGLQREAELLNVYSEHDAGRAAVTTRPLGVVGTDREQLQATPRSIVPSSPVKKSVLLIRHPGTEPADVPTRGHGTVPIPGAGF